MGIKQLLCNHKVGTYQVSELFYSTSSDKTIRICYKCNKILSNDYPKYKTWILKLKRIFNYV